MKKIAVVLMNLGGPNNEEAVQPFLYNLFMDEDILKIPRLMGLKPGLVKYLTGKRAKKVVEKYKEINACPEGCRGPASCSNRINKVVSTCCSATNPNTELQRRALEKRLNAQAHEASFKVLTAMRYWNPNTDAALDEIEKGEFDQVILLPLYPHFSFSSSASSFNEWNRRVKARGLEGKWKTYIIPHYHLHGKYLQSLNQRIDEALEKIPEANRDQTHLLFSAHGTPVYFQKNGDPYSRQIKETIEAVMRARGFDRPYWQSYQSRVGPIEWLKPNSEHFIEVLYGYGIRHLVVIPVSFVSDHIETLMEVEIEFKEIADELGFEHFICSKGINDMPLFIDFLGDLVESHIQAPVSLEDIQFAGKGE